MKTYHFALFIDIEVLLYLLLFKIRVDSREEFSLWCCRLHNEVNEKLGYESKYDPCEITSLDQRWLVGRKACWDADD
jgi:hypothetical protein